MDWSWCVGFFLLLGWEWGEEHYSDVSMDTVHRDKTIYKMYMIFILYIYLFQNNFIFNERCYDRIFIRKNKVLLKQEKKKSFKSLLAIKLSLYCRFLASPFFCLALHNPVFSD